MVSVALFLPGLLRHPGEDRPLPLFVEDGEVVLIFVGGHFLRQVHALQEQLQKLIVNGVNFFTDLRKFHDFPPTVSLTARRR